MMQGSRTMAPVSADSHLSDATAPDPRAAGPRRAGTGPTSVAIAGAGYIADYHVEILKELGSVAVVGVCDPDRGRREALCRRWGIPHAAGSLEELFRDQRPEVVHVLVPPPFHFEVAERALAEGLHVFLEKPMALRAAECDRLLDLARTGGRRLGVNHNAAHHPLYRRLRADIDRRRLGRIEHVVSVNNLPLAQLAAGDHDHWMFRRPENVLFEQGCHPLSQVCDLLGAVRRAATTGADERRLRTGAIFPAAWQLDLTCERGTAQVFLSFGRSFPEAWLHVLGQDGAARIDLINDVYVLDRRTRYVDPLDVPLRVLGHAGQGAWCGVRRLAAYGLSTLRLTGRSDSYYRGMRDSIAAFHRSLAPGGPEDGSAALGRRVIAALERAVAAWEGPEDRGPEAAAGPAIGGAPAAHDGDRRDGEVLVLGGTGFIGRRLVPALLAAGHPVRLMARRPALVAAAVGAGGLSVCAGDVRNADDVDRAVAGCRTVIHLVAGAPANWPEFEDLFVAGTRHVAEACLRRGVSRLVFASTIAVYDLGRRGATVTEATPLDDRPERRNLYTRAKIACERLLMDLHRTRGLPVTIVRPGVVVGAGGPAQHLGVGHWPSATHCITWGGGTDPIPFVLVDDVVAALVAAVDRPGLEGRSFNLAGDVWLTAREYLAALRALSGRDIRVHRQAIAQWMAVDLIKWAIKAVAGKPGNDFPSYRDLASRRSAAQLDCAAAKQALGWAPVADRERFIDLGIRRALAGDDGG